jgi:hypothetical protein
MSSMSSMIDSRRYFIFIFIFSIEIVGCQDEMG